MNKFIKLVLASAVVALMSNGFALSKPMDNVKLRVMPISLGIWGWDVSNGRYNYGNTNATVSVTLDQNPYGGSNIVHMYTAIPSTLAGNNAIIIPNAIRMVTKGSDLANGSFVLQYSLSLDGQQNVQDNARFFISNGVIQNVFQSKSVGSTSCILSGDNNNNVSITCNRNL